VLPCPHGQPIIAALNFPSLPEGMVKQLSDLIEVSDLGHAEPLITLVRKAQVLQSRAKDAQARAAAPSASILTHSNAMSGVILSAEIFARCGRLFVYARGDGNQAPETTTAHDVKEALKPLPIPIPWETALEQEIDRLAEVHLPAIWPDL
jgi:hypothetical protein